jgi:Outer membrane lipoprotein-sorting protein
MKIFSVIAAIFLFVVANAMAQTTNTLSDPEIEGRALAQKILEQQPMENSTNTGVLEIRDATGKRTSLSMKFEVFVQSTERAHIDWRNNYEAHLANGFFERLFITRHIGSSNTYLHNESSSGFDWALDNQLSTNSFTPFANSDFSLGDLGLEFFHWPAQKVLKKEVHRSRGCTVLESTNPYPVTNGYSRVVSWIDNESLGIVEAYAYDANGKKLKDFYPKDFKKVDGQWQVQTLVMENVQTGSRSRLEFDLKKQ